MEHLFDEYEAKAAAASAAAGSSKDRYRSPPASAASTRIEHDNGRDAQAIDDSDVEPVSLWTKYYPKTQQCPPGPSGPPKPRSPEEYKAFQWRETHRRQDLDSSSRPPRPNLPGFGVNRRPAQHVIEPRPVSRLPGFGGYRKGPHIITAAQAAAQPTTLSWEATLAAVNAASGGRPNIIKRPESKQKQLIRIAPRMSGSPGLMPILLSQPSKPKAAGPPPQSARTIFIAPMLAGQRRPSPSMPMRRSSPPRQAPIPYRAPSEEAKPSLAALQEVTEVEHEENVQRPRSSDGLASLIQASEAMDWPRVPTPPLDSCLGEPTKTARPLFSPVITVSTSEEKRKRLPKLVIPDTGEATSIDEVSLADALAMLSASVLEKTDLDVLELLKLGLEQHKMRAGKRDRSQKSASSASASASPRSRPPLKKRIRHRPSKGKSSPGNDSLSPPSGSTEMSSPSPFTPVNSSKLRSEMAKRESIDLRASP